MGMREIEIGCHWLGRGDIAHDFPGQVDAGAFTEPQELDVIVQSILPELHRQLGGADVARMDQDIVHAAIADRMVVMQEFCPRSSSEPFSQKISVSGV